MGKITGFLEFDRKVESYEKPEERVKNYKEFTLPLEEKDLKDQGARCMNCGIPFCHSGCPLGNLIPDFNDAVYKGKWEKAAKILHATNNFPEFTGRLCPAPCEEACVLGIINPPVSIELIEKYIVERGFKEGWIKADPPLKRTGKTVAVIGSGPAGLAAAQQLNRAGHTVTVFERDEKVGENDDNVHWRRRGRWRRRRGGGGGGRKTERGEIFNRVFEVYAIRDADD